MFEEYNKKSMRLENYDYAQPGDYFVTICTKNYTTIFGKVLNNKVELNEHGRIANEYWEEIPEHFSNTKLDEYIIMPNHIHGIINITGQLSEPTKARKFAQRKAKNFVSDYGFL